MPHTKQLIVMGALASVRPHVGFLSSKYGNENKLFRKDDDDNYERCSSVNQCITFSGDIKK